MPTGVTALPVRALLSRPPSSMTRLRILLVGGSTLPRSSSIDIARNLVDGGSSSLPSSLDNSFIHASYSPSFSSARLVVALRDPVALLPWPRLAPRLSTVGLLFATLLIGAAFGAAGCLSPLVRPPVVRLVSLPCSTAAAVAWAPSPPSMLVVAVSTNCGRRADRGRSHNCISTARCRRTESGRCSLCCVLDLFSDSSHSSLVSFVQRVSHHFVGSVRIQRERVFVRCLCLSF